MEMSFRNAPELMQAIEGAVKQFGSDRRVFSQLSDSERQYFRQNYAQSPESAASHLVDARGYLHHQSGRRSLNWDPSSQSTHRVDAHFLEWTCLLALQHFGTPILFEENEVRRFEKTAVTTREGHKVTWNMG